MSVQTKIASLLLLIVIIDVGLAAFSKVPPPPRRPDHLLSREDLKRYLQKVHEYHSILGRWRLRREFHDHKSSNALTDDLIKTLTDNQDHADQDVKLLKH